MFGVAREAAQPGRKERLDKGRKRIPDKHSEATFLKRRRASLTAEVKPTAEAAEAIGCKLIF